MHLEPLPFAVEAMTRSKRVDFEKLRQRDPEFVAMVEEAERQVGLKQWHDDASGDYWNPKNETLAREELRALQHLKLKRLCEWAYAKSPFHRRRWERAGFHPDQLQSLDDLERIPFMTREEWMEAQAEAPPFGSLPAVARIAVRYHTTSGTTGRTPLRVLDGTKDWEWIAEMWCYGLWGFGLRPNDVVLFAFSYGTFIGFWGAHYACEKIGCLVLSTGAATTESRVKSIIDMGVTTVCSTPTYALRLWQTAAEMGIDLARDSKVDKLIVSGEPAGSIPASSVSSRRRGARRSATPRG